MTIERTDFMSVPVQDMERAKRFYSEKLGLHSPNLEDGWPEFERDTEGNALMLHRRYASYPDGSLP